MANVFVIRLAGSERAEWTTSDACDASDALNLFADYLESRDVPAFWHRDADGADCIRADGDTYYAHERTA